MYNKKIFKRCFHWRGKYWYKNIKEIPLYFKLMHHLIKHGYDEYATWETFDWFIDTMKEILTSYRKSHIGYPISSFVTEYDEEKVAKEYDAGLDKMIVLLDDMDENNLKYKAEKYKDIDGIVNKHNEMYAAKDEFFKIFSEYFYNLWD